jgi:hypothetical protein
MFHEELELIAAKLAVDVIFEALKINIATVGLKFH